MRHLARYLKVWTAARKALDTCAYQSELPIARPSDMTSMSIEQDFQRHSNTNMNTDHLMSETRI